MRKPVKPFQTEYKTRKPPKAAALFDEFDVHAGDERPPRDVNEDLSQHHDGSYEEALRAADAVFGSPATGDERSAAPEMRKEPEKRILSDLSYVDPLQARLDAPVPRRGRKPGLKNLNKELLPTVQATTIVNPAIETASDRVPQQKVSRRQRPGFRQKLAMLRSAKPGERWKFALRVHPGSHDARAIRRTRSIMAAA